MIPHTSATDQLRCTTSGDVRRHEQLRDEVQIVNRDLVTAGSMNPCERLLSFLYEPEIDVKRDVVSNVDVDLPSMANECQ